MSQTPDSSSSSYYDLVGGEEFFTKLIHHFYEHVAKDEPLRALYPEEDLGPAEERLFLFMMQYWGGPTTYSQRRGHPRLRMRHVPYHIDDDMRDRWLRAMRAAIDEMDLSPELEEPLWTYCVQAAHALVNVHPGLAKPAKAQESFTVSPMTD